VLSYHYLRGMSLSAIGALLAVTESRACQLHRAALEKLRQEVAREEAS
jgi:RNA polymerase sigma factor for flagellar operon FliA